MNRRNLILVLFTALCAACSSNRVADQSLPSFGGAFVDDKGAAKKLVLKFSPETPHYEVVRNKENTLSEVLWRCRADQNFSKEFVFTERGRGVKKASINVDAKTGVGTMTLWHDATDAFSVSRQSPTELVLLPDDPFRQLASTNDASASHRINLSVKGAPLDKVIRTLAAESNKSLILGSSVSGQVSVDLKNLTYEQAIDMILRPTAYRAEHAGDVTIIRSAKDDKTFRAFKLRYLDVVAAMKLVQAIASKDAQVTADPNSNTIFVVDRFEALKNIELMLAAMDIEPKQVEVESAILSVELDSNMQFGIDWNGVLHTGTTPGGLVANPIGTSILSPINAMPQPAQNGVASVPVQGAYVGVTWQSLNGVLSALSSKTKTDVLARPHVLALSDEDAQVTIGSKLGYSTTTFSNTGQAIQNVNFLEVGTILKIRPHVTPNNDIIMALKPQVSSGQIDANTHLPTESTTESDTKVLARNGQTIVLAGLMQDRVEHITNRIPVLGDIPLLGGIFGGTTNINQKTELVILLTPRIVTNDTFARMDKGARERVGRFYDENGLEVPQRVGQIGAKESP